MGYQKPQSLDQMDLEPKDLAKVFWFRSAFEEGSGSKRSNLGMEDALKLWRMYGTNVVEARRRYDIIVERNAGQGTIETAGVVQVVLNWSGDYEPNPPED